jgi:hypothetical protein
MPSAAENGCDSILYLNLTINQSTNGIDSQFSCGTFQWIDGKTYEENTSSEFYAIKGGAASGCDSIVQLVLKVQRTKAEIEQEGNTLKALNSSGTFQWGRCESFGFNPIDGENGATYTVLSNGSYALEVFNESCADTSDCLEVQIAGIQFEKDKIKFRIHPNPATHAFYISGPLLINHLTISNLLGEVVYDAPYNQDLIVLNAKDFTPGLYSIQVLASDHQYYSSFFLVR